MTSLRRSPLLLELDLTTAPIEVEPDDLVAKVRTRHRPRLRAVVRALHEAGSDARVRGMIVRLGAGLTWSAMQEIRAGLVAFAASGKPTVAWAETLGDSSSGTVDYLLATACSEIWLQPTAELGLLGVASEVTFLRGLLDNVGVEPQLDKRYEYKSAADRIMNREFTAEHREATDRVSASVWDAAVATVAAARDLAEDEVRRLADTAPLSAAEAKEAGLIDHVGYRDQVYADVKRRVGDDVELLFADQWRPKRSAAELVRRDREVVALVDAHGEIVSGRSRTGPRGPQLGGDTVSAALRAAREDEHVKAVVFRIDSPGGSAVASDTIWREVVLVREAGKPVIVSMGELAGSGGYFVACPADVIIAQPSTITGSIGVLGGKVVVDSLLDRVGLGTGVVEHGAHARMFSTRRGFTDGEREHLGRMLDRIYVDFVQKVADGRGMGYDAVHAIARGRIWSGADASRNGLVDQLGGLRDAVALARERAGLPTTAKVRPAVHVPPLARLGRARSSEDPRALAGARAASIGSSVSAELVGALGPFAGPLAELAAALGMPGGALLRMPDLRLV